MHLRPITRADLPDVATVFCSARDESDLWDFLCPRRKQYPEAFRAQNIARTHLSLLDSAVQGFVCVSDADDAALSAKRTANGSPVPVGTVLGSSWWYRSSTSPERRARDGIPAKRDSWFESLERILRRVEGWYVDHICPNPAVSCENHAEFARLGREEDKKHRQPLKGRVPHWILTGLGVHQDFQGYGAGRRMVQWGLDQAKAEWDAASEQQRTCKEVALAVTLIAVPGGIALYERMGFKVVGDKDGPFLPKLPNSDESSMYMIWDPLEQWTRETEKDGQRYVVYRSETEA